MDKYKFQCKTVCLKCEQAVEFYNPEDKLAKVYVVVCKKCDKKVTALVKLLKKKQYWTTK